MVPSPHLEVSPRPFQTGAWIFAYRYCQLLEAKTVRFDEQIMAEDNLGDNFCAYNPIN